MSDRMPHVMPMVALRPPEQVMRLARMGSFHQCRLSFMRQLLRRMVGGGWRIARGAWEMDERGVGHAVYTVDTGARVYALVAFAHDLPDDQRSDRVIAEAWDATFALHDGVPGETDIERLRANVPLQEAGRVSEKELTLSRANRSVRLWTSVVDALAQGRQPDAAELDAVGYLMRTTAVYGSGKFGAADREVIAGRAEMAVPFQAEMLSVYLIRLFVRDLVEHMARARGGTKAARLSPSLARRLGIGNSTGLGMAPFLINHPRLLNNWIMARETALARVRAVEEPTAEEIARFREVFARAASSVRAWRSEHPIQTGKLKALNADIEALREHLNSADLSKRRAWDRLYLFGEAQLSCEGQEWLASLLLEPYGHLVDGLGECMADPCDPPRADGRITIAEARALIERHYRWALGIDWAVPEAQARAWYVSEEKLEPRLGERHEEPVAAYEQPLGPARDAAAAHRALAEWSGEDRVAAFLIRHPEHRAILARAGLLDTAPYAEIRDNTLAADLLPIDMLRAKLSFFGATRFDPRSDRWVRISMFSGAPYPEDFPAFSDDWVYPEPGA